MSKEINIKNVLAYIAANTKMISSRFGMVSEVLVEQVAYRESKCPDCKSNGKCNHCGCSTPGIWFTNSSCNGGERFPELMKRREWDQFKLDNNIKI